MNFVCHYEKKLDRNQLVAKVLAAVPARPDAERWFISFCLDKPVFQKAATDADLPTGWGDLTTGGHLFDDLVESKWKQDRDGFHLWTLYESDTETSPLVNPRRNDLSYYCLGTWNVADNCFRDGRLPDVLKYPLTGSQKDHRMFFKVAEYSPRETISIDPGETDKGAIVAAMERMTSQLNQPRVLMHRLMGVGVDSGNDGHYGGER